jgi:hypothetical protein
MAMARVILPIALVVAACGGPQVPEHNGYRSDKAKPWKKAKVLKWDANGEAKSEGDLSYADMRRAAWFEADLPGSGDLTVNIDSNGPGDEVDDNFDLGVEVLDPGNRVLVRKDLEEGDQTNEPKKQLALPELPAGHYLIHLYLQARLDTADYTLKVTFRPGKGATGRSDFPAQVAFLPPLPMVPINDDTPKTYRPPPTTVTVVTHKRHDPVPRKEDKPPPPTKLSTRIIGISVVTGGTQITVARGTATGASAGMQGQIVGIANGSFTLAACNEHQCTAIVKATPEQLKSAFNVQLGN